MRRRPLSRLVYGGIAYSCVGLGALGVVLPLLPTTPFMLVALWAAGKSSPRLARWLREHRHLGPTLCAWQEHRAIPISAKRLACATLALSWVIMAALGMALGVLVTTGTLFIVVGTFILTRPNAPVLPPER
ncbi:YbaN family protein [Halomonas sp. Bachu 37]|uniref:YbaN family protein n=1 Tax=Halomonas kashgarensis TaxID=3084920 RepID=UPI003217045B